VHLDRQRLCDILDILKISYGNKVMDVSYCVKFVVDNEAKAVYLSTTDFHAFLMVDFGDVSLSRLDDVPAEFLIQFRQLYSVIKASTTEDVTITRGSNENHVLIETNGVYKFHLYGDPTLFPVANFVVENVLGKWESGELRDIIDKVKIAVSKDVTKLSYQGINFDGNWAASDNRRLSIVQLVEGDEDAVIPILIPPVICEIITHCKGELTLGVNADSSMLIINNVDSGLVAGIRLIDEKFVQYGDIVKNRRHYIKMMMPKQHLLGVLRRIGSFTDKLFKVANLSVMYENGQGAYLKVSIENNDGGEEILDAMDFDYSDTLPENGVEELASHSYQIDNLTIGINAVESDDEVSLCIQDDGKLWIDEDNFHYLLSRITS